MTCATEKCPLIHTILISTRSGASRVAMTREMSERNKRFLCSLLILPLAHSSGSAGPMCSSWWRSSWVREGPGTRRSKRSASSSACRTLTSFSSQPRSREAGTPRLSGSTASYLRRARWATSRGTTHLITPVLLELFLLLLSLLEQSLQGIELCWLQGFKESLDHYLLNRGAIQRHAGDVGIMAL